jgi:hypothetical protein
MSGYDFILFIVEVTIEFPGEQMFDFFVSGQVLPFDDRYQVGIPEHAIKSSNQTKKYWLFGLQIVQSVYSHILKINIPTMTDLE